MSYKSKTWRLDLQLYCFAPAKCPLSCSKCLSVTCQTIKIVGRIETCELKGKLNTHKTHTQKKTDLVQFKMSSKFTSSQLDL